MIIQSIFETIAKNPFLQAISIVVSCGSLVIFVSKLIWPFVQFINNFVTVGLKKAYVKSIRGVLRKVRLDSKDSNLISTRLFLYTVSAFIGLIFPIFLVLLLYFTEKTVIIWGLNNSQHRSFNLYESMFIILVAMPIGFSLSWITISPTLRLMRYIRFMRRHLLRRLKARLP